MTHSKDILLTGSPSPLGTVQTPNGINFAFFSSDAEAAELSFFEPKETIAFLKVTLSPELHKTGSIWHLLVKNLKTPFEYTIKIYKNGIWSQELIDPYAKALSSSSHWNQRNHYHPKARWIPPHPFDWQETAKPKTPLKDWIIYEMHVRAFTNHPSSMTIHPGTFLGVIEKIPYFKKLGINAIELLPVFEFDECENKLKNPSTQAPLYNFWGYSTVNFFCPMQRYASSEIFQAPIIEFKTMVRELHKNGISVILDVVYNHTAESGEEGPTLSFKGLDLNAYYCMDPNGKFYNFSGTGNTLNCNHPIVTKLITDSLAYWAGEMQVDAFRFDLASILTRDSTGEPLLRPPVLEAMEEIICLHEAIFIAEAWDAGGLYQVGSFPGQKGWSEWNGKYRDVVRNFIKGTPGYAGDFAKALCGSENLYWKDSPTKSINFITAHDGYSLKDLVSYQHKYNWENGENNQDGCNDNCSWNCGEEGETENLQILQLRTRQMKNFIVSLMISLGVPMILMGDEYAHTRYGNNNPYPQDNETNWFLWDKLEKQSDLFLFFQKLIQFRKKNKHLFCKEQFLTDQDVTWHGLKPFLPNWEPQSQFIAYVLKDPLHQEDCFICFNAQNSEVLVELPHLEGKKWVRMLDTSLDSPLDCIENLEKMPLCESSYALPSYSSFIAISIAKE